jgi:hypothetical protein
MQDEEEVGNVAGMREVHTNCSGKSARKRLFVRLKCE